jgi:hypothetical protein
VFDPPEKQRRYQQALDAFVERLEQDRSVLAAVLVGSLEESVIWRREAISLWIIEADGVTRRLRSDGGDERLFRTLVENGVNIHAELIPRSRFRRMVEGSSRTAFTHSFFARRILVYARDPSIERWFTEADRLATRDQEKELLAVTTWVIHAHRHADKLLRLRKDRQLARQEILFAAWGLAALEIVRAGEVYEEEAIHRALELRPELFREIWVEITEKAPTAKRLGAALDRIARYLDDHADAHLKPLLAYLRKEKRVVALSEIGDHFAHSQLYPWHLESACEWLERKGRLEKVAAPFKLTTQSRGTIEEPAYFLDE